MASLPRIITVDPTGNVARTVRAAIDLSEYAVRQVDVPTATEALDELELGGSNLVISSLTLEDMSAEVFVEKIQAAKPNVAIIVLADEIDPVMDLDEQQERGFVYLQRPLDVQQFTRVLFGGMKGSDIFTALRAPAAGGSSGPNYSPPPSLDLDKAGPIIDQLLIDLGAMSILLLERTGTVLLQRGADSYLKHDQLLEALRPSMMSNINMRDIVGGDATTLQFFDGDNRDVYTLSVGLHHMMTIAYDGERGQREFGMVNRLGRKAALDLIALLGAEAFFIREVAEAVPVAEEDTLVRRNTRGTTMMQRVQADEAEDAPAIARATEFGGGDAAPSEGGFERVELEAIEDFDPELLANLDSIDLSQADDLFSLESLEEVDVDVRPNRAISQDDAFNMGILGE
jgi:DNA-binding NarL/FixJ family response regulator